METKVQNNKPTEYQNENTLLLLKELQKIALENVRIQAKNDLIAQHLEREAEAEKSKLYDERAKLVLEMMNSPFGDGPVKKVLYFWLNVLKLSKVKAYVTEDDEQILKSLYDIRNKISIDNDCASFQLQFHFLPNDFFTNAVLTKTYHTRTLEKWHNIYDFDAYRVKHSEGCKIDWTETELARRQQQYLTYWSFFDFFDPPVIPHDPKGYTFDDINMRKLVLQQDYYIGCYFKEKLIPRAELYFRIEAPKLQEKFKDELCEEEEDDDEDFEEEELDEEEENNFSDRTLVKGHVNEAAAVGGAVDEHDHAEHDHKILCIKCCQRLDGTLKN